MSKIYGVIAEFKNQAPMIMESEGRYLTEDGAYERMREISKRPDCIRVAVFKAAYIGGNQSLLPTEGE